MPRESCACCDHATAPKDSNRADGLLAEKILLAISGALAVAAEGLAYTTQQESSAPVVVLAIISILCGGRSTLLAALRSVRALSLDIHFLMAIAVVGALCLGQWPEAAMVLFLFEVAERIEAATLSHAKNSIQDLMRLAPETARVQSDNGDWQEIESAQARVGARVLVKPGERIALDGKIVAGISSLNQAPITGESLPVEKTVGAEVFAGSINGVGALEVLVTRASTDSTLARIVRLVEQAQSQQAPAQRLVEKFARYYTPAVVIGAILVAAIPPLFFAQSFPVWFGRALVLLVISCPCALVISTPVAIWCGLAAAARRGILIKGGAVLERGRDLKIIAFDKTGTLTQGRPQVTDIIALNGLPQSELLRLSASLETHSEHPLASAIVEKWNGQKPLQSDDGESHNSLSVVKDFQAVSGRGATGELDGRAYFIGNHRLVHERNVCNARVEAELSRLENEGRSTLVFGDDTQSLAIFGVADAPRVESAEALSALRELGIATVLLTGDNARAAQKIAEEVGISDVRAQLLPEDKMAALETLQAEYSCVGMVGDGINDTPALAKAHIGFVMGAAGSDAALEVADVALMNDDLRKIPQFIRLSRATTRVLGQNVFAALAIKAVFFALAISGHANLWMAVFADVGASLLVVFNSLRLLRFR